MLRLDARAPRLFLLFPAAALAWTFAGCTISTGAPVVDVPAPLALIPEWRLRRNAQPDAAELMVVGPYRIIDLAEIAAPIDSAIRRGGHETTRTRTIRMRVVTGNVSSVVTCRTSVWRRTTRGVFEGGSWEWMSRNTEARGSVRCTPGGVAESSEIVYMGPDSLAGSVTSATDTLAIQPIYSPGLPRLGLPLPPAIVFLRRGVPAAFADLRNGGRIRMEQSLDDGLGVLVAGTIAGLIECPAMLKSQFETVCATGPFL